MDLRDLFGIEHPIIQAPMAGAQNHLLAAALRSAGDAEIRCQVTALVRDIPKYLVANLLCKRVQLTVLH